MARQYEVRVLNTPTESDDLNVAWERGWRLHTLIEEGDVAWTAVFERRSECGDEVYSEPLARNEVEQEMEEVN